MSIAAPVEPVSAELHWQPLLTTFGPEVAAQFMWVVTTDTVETYEHRETQRFLHIDGVTGECLNQNCEAISSESALQHALRPSSRPAAAPPAAELQAAEASQPAPAAADPEPKLNAFTRKADTPALIEEAFLPTHEGSEASGSLRKLFARTRRLGHSLSWSGSQVPAPQDFGSHLQGSQEPSLATFTRRTSFL